MVGKLLSLTLVAIGAAASSLVERQAMVSTSGNTVTVSGVSSGEIIIIETNQGGGAGWSQVNPTVAAPAATHTVVVGSPSEQTIYTPDTVNAAVGDVVEFQFLAKNHSVTQSSFTAPCVNSHMFDTGFVPNPSSTMPPPAMRVQVNVATPQWFYCRQKGHCGKGMVFSINPTAAKTQAMFQQAAIAQNGTSADATTAAPAAGGNPYSTTAASATTAATAMPSVASGSGTVGSDGSCSCSCLCGSTAFGASQGMGAFGGFGGMLSPAGAGN